MAVRYKLVKINNNITESEETKYSVTTVSYGNINLDTLAERMATYSTFNIGEIKGMLENLTRMIADSLKDGYTVSIEGLGTLSVTAQVNREVTTPSQIRAESIKLKSIGFKPSPKLKERLSDIEFTKLR